MRSSEHRAVADDGQRRQPVAQPLGQRAARAPRCRPPARRPAASARRRRRAARAPAARARRAAPPSARAIRRRVRRRPSSVRAAQPGSRSRSTPVSSSRPPLRYSGRPVSASRPVDRARRPTRTAPAASRSATARACGTASSPAVRPGPAHRGVAPAVAQRLIADHVVRQARFPTATVSSCDRMSWRGAPGRDRAVPARRTGRRAGRRSEHVGLRGQRLAEPVQQRDAAVEADQRIVRRDLERLGQPVGVSARSPAASTRSGSRRVAGEQPGSEGVQARHAQALRSG